jgi:hypothetical protein
MIEMVKFKILILWQSQKTMYKRYDGHIRKRVGNPLFRFSARGRSRVEAMSKR